MSDMWKALKRFWAYLGAAFGAKVEEKADPKIQLEQAIEEAKKRHQLLTQQAASVIGQEKELELKLGRKLEEIENLQGSAAQALRMGDEATAKGDGDGAKRYGDAAQSFAMELVTAENQARELKGMHDGALTAADQARKAVEQNAMNLQEQMSERSKLLGQLENAKMQERLNDALGQMDAMAPKGDTPTLAEVRDKIEQRYAKALGASELRDSSVMAKRLEVQQAALDAQAAARLDQLRHQLSIGDTTISVGEPDRAPAPAPADPDADGS
jgi:phage shock protein A